MDFSCIRLLSFLLTTLLIDLLMEVAPVPFHALCDDRPLKIIVWYLALGTCRIGTKVLSLVSQFTVGLMSTAHTNSLFQMRSMTA